MKALLVINLIALVLFAVMYVVVPLSTELGVGMRFTELDRAGVVNEKALQEFNRSGLIRNWVPRYIAEDALVSEKRNALMGCALAFLNSALCTCALLRSRSTRRKVDSSTEPAD